ncbi:glycosidase [Asticcacaulis sp.]|uniref:glycoside hydrolase family 130 protein n=1 Tax=Asticcacaulis sp. TaxID=1872648 RepID=UPI0026194C62|nr:glycosidase [Asticcacaulis sp.]
MCAEFLHSASVLRINPKRTVLRPYFFTSKVMGQAQSHITRAQHICQYILGLSFDECHLRLTELSQGFISGHPHARKYFLERFEDVKKLVGPYFGGMDDIEDPHAALIGAYFCREYAFEAAAVMNPSIVTHPDQTGLVDGATRFCLSVRCVGEGHLSTLAFRSVLILEDGTIELEPEPPFAVEACPLAHATAGPVTLVRPDGLSLFATVIFPITSSQAMGIEDLRLVEFTQENGETVYLGTYTAYSGSETTTELFETTDFQTIQLTPLQGAASAYKGLALFPRRINGYYAAIGRLDLENLHYLETKDPRVWNYGQTLLSPRHGWELVQIGTCGPPIELDEGWLLLIYGVGAMRRYGLGAVLLDKSDPRKVLARSKAPLLAPQADTREGYVPNVIHSCGSIRHKDRVIIPYAVAESSIRFVSVTISSLLADLRGGQ